MSLGSILAVILVTTSPDVVRPQAQAPPEALRNMVRAYQTAWNAHDATAVVAFYASDADEVLADGPATIGREALQRSYTARFASMEPGRKISLTVTAIRMVTPSVAVINTVATTGGRTPGGQALSASTDRGTWILVQKDGRWLMAGLRVYAAERATPP